MCASPTFEDPPPPGYVSAKAKNTYMLAAGLLAGFFFLAQNIIPFIAMLVLMPSMMFFSFEMEQPVVQRSVFWEGRIWYPTESFTNRSQRRTKLANLVVGSKDDEDDEDNPGIEVAMSRSWPLAGDDTLWLISRGAVGYYEAGHVIVVKPRKRLGEISPPFWYRGNPAVVEKTPRAGHTLWTFADGEWNKQASLSLSVDPGQLMPGRNNVVGSRSSPWDQGFGSLDLQIVPVADNFHVFMRIGQTLYHADDLGVIQEQPKPNGVTREEEDKWQVVGQIDGEWSALELDG